MLLKSRLEYKERGKSKKYADETFLLDYLILQNVDNPELRKKRKKEIIEQVLQTYESFMRHNSCKEVEEELGNEGRILVRPSGTEPLLRVMVEAKSDELCHKYVYRVIDFLKEKGL